MDLWLKRIGSHLHADGDESIAEMAKLPLGVPLHAVIRRPRNLAHHRLFWALVHRIAGGAGVDAEVVCDLLKIGTGHYKLVKSKNYGELRFPRSISFAAMGQDDFNVFFERALQTIFEEWGIERSAFADLQL